MLKLNSSEEVDPDLCYLLLFWNLHDAERLRVPECVDCDLTMNASSRPALPPAVQAALEQVHEREAENMPWRLNIYQKSRR